MLRSVKPVLCNSANSVLVSRLARQKTVNTGQLKLQSMPLAYLSDPSKNNSNNSKSFLGKFFDKIMKHWLVASAIAMVITFFLLLSSRKI